MTSFRRLKIGIPGVLFCGGSLVSVYAAPAAPAGQPIDGAPRSGALTWEISVTDPDGTPQGPKSYRRVYFDKTNVRTEEWDSMGLASIFVTGQTPWVGNPGLRRYEIWDESYTDRFRNQTYPAAQRRLYENRVRHAEPTAGLAPDGQRVWSFVDTHIQDSNSCLSPPSSTTTTKLNANPAFPVPLSTTKCTSFACTTTQLTKMELDAPQPPSLFTYPPGWSKVRYFTRPARPFQIDVQVRITTFSRNPREADDVRTAVKSFRGDGTAIAESVTLFDTKGAALPATTVVDTNTAFLTSNLPALYELGHLPDGARHATLIRHEFMLGLPVQVFAYRANQRNKHVYWIAEHPTLGTIVLRHTQETGEKLTDTAVTTINLNPKPGP